MCPKSEFKRREGSPFLTTVQEVNDMFVDMKEGLNGGFVFGPRTNFCS